MVLNCGEAFRDIFSDYSKWMPNEGRGPGRKVYSMGSKIGEVL